MYNHFVHVCAHVCTCMCIVHVNVCVCVLLSSPFRSYQQSSHTPGLILKVSNSSMDCLVHPFRLWIGATYNRAHNNTIIYNISFQIYEQMWL